MKMNKRGQFDDLNLGAWALLTGVGLITLFIMFTVWGRMDFEVGTVTKIILYILTVPVAYIFTRIMFE